MYRFILLLFSIAILFSCKKEEVKDPVLADNYGNGMYVVTSSGVSYRE